LIPRDYSLLGFCGSDVLVAATSRYILLSSSFSENEFAQFRRGRVELPARVAMFVRAAVPLPGARSDWLGNSCVLKGRYRTDVAGSVTTMFWLYAKSHQLLLARQPILEAMRSRRRMLWSTGPVRPPYPEPPTRYVAIRTHASQKIEPTPASPDFCPLTVPFRDR